METTLIILKPDALQRGLAGRLITRFEERGMEILGMSMEVLDRSKVQEHYDEHKGRPFFESLVGFMTSAPAVLIALRGLRAIQVCRTMIGATEGCTALPGTIRGDFCQFRTYNLIHASDGPVAATRELNLWFPALRVDETKFNRLDSHYVFGI